MFDLLLFRFSNDPNIRGMGWFLLGLTLVGFVLTSRFRFIRCPVHVLGERLKMWILGVSSTISFLSGILVVRLWLSKIPWIDHLFNDAGFMVVVIMSLVALLLFILLIILSDIILLRLHQGYRNHFAVRSSTNSR